MRIRILPALLFLAPCLAAQAAPSVVYVDCTAPGPEHDGSTWDTAFLTIQEGVDAATPGGEVWVADGVYVENVIMGAGVAIYGGFLGAEEGGYETERDQRDFTANTTAIDGNQSGSCVVMAVDATVDGFTMTNGTGTLEDPLTRYGGGVYCAQLGESGMIANNSVAGNTATHGGGIYCRGSSPAVVSDTVTQNSAERNGGGIYCRSDSSPMIASNTITHNSTERMGGGICCNSASPAVTDNLIAWNYSHEWGAGFYCSSSAGTLARNTITGNEARWGAAVECRGATLAVTDNTITDNLCRGIGCDACPEITFVSNRITGNIVDEDGAGMECSHSSLIVIGNDITANTAERFGGAIYCWYCSPVVMHNTIKDNVSLSGAGGVECYRSSAVFSGNVITLNSGDDGGGLAVYGYHYHTTVSNNLITRNSAQDSGGGLYVGSYHYATIIHNLIAENSAAKGGAINSGQGLPTIADNMIIWNSASYSGGAVFSRGCKVDHLLRLTNDTIAGNSSPNGAALACDSSGYHPSIIEITNCVLWNGGGEVWNNDEPWITIVYSDVQGGWPGEGNIDADPMFVDPESGDFHLLPESPCIDAGSNDHVSSDEDFDGDPRIIWARRFPLPYWPHPGYVDIGADEFVPPGR